VLDANLNLLPIGVAGELYIGGAGVARGYLDRADLTRERFISSSFHPSGRLYRTGDLARWLPDGTLECLGRADNQVKIRGFRVEIEEIEAAMATHPGVRQAAVRTWNAASGPSLAAYVVADGNPDLRRHLQHVLPEYMIPARMVFLDALPLTPNGKVDRNALPEPGPMESTGKYAAPSSAIERRLARIFESVLDVPRVGVRENFFDLGGHSLLVAKLLRGIELEFGRRLTMPAIFQSPTIQHLASLLGEQSCLATGPRTVDIRPAGGRAPFFWIYGGPFFSSLISRLHPAHPLVSVALDARDERAIVSSSDLATLAQIAEPLVHQIRATQPSGPYRLGGWCVAGLIAYEVASQIVAAGEQVQLLAMVGTPNPVYDLSLPTWKVYAGKLRHGLTKLRRLHGRSACDYALERMKRLAASVRDSDGPTTNFEGVVAAAALRYIPKPVDARIAVIRPSDRPEVPDLKIGWEQVLGDRLDVYDVAGDHTSMFLEPHVEGLAACLNRCLNDRAIQVQFAGTERRAIAG
jgi:thioesterase domain-containing protein